MALPPHGYRRASRRPRSARRSPPSRCTAAWSLSADLNLTCSTILKIIAVFKRVWIEIGTQRLDGPRLFEVDGRVVNYRLWYPKGAGEPAVPSQGC